MKENPLHSLSKAGQSVWLDNLDRAMLESGSLDRRIREDGVSGITSNPKTFHEAITGTDVYSGEIASAAHSGATAKEIYERLAVRDVQDAADRLDPIFKSSHGRDGFVSLEVSPHLAHDAKGTIQEARRLWNQVARPNVLIKIPGTLEGLPAIEQCVADGIPINVTLLFSLRRFGVVHSAYLRAIERRLEQGESPGVAFFASFFLSRIDAKVDPMLDEVGTTIHNVNTARNLRGRVALASAKMAYESWLRRLRSKRWARLSQAGAQPQRLLWAGTSTKDPGYSDIKYIEALIGPHTVSTMPEKTLEAFRDHGYVKEGHFTLRKRIKEERRVLRSLGTLGIDLESVTDELVDEGIEKFARPFDALLGFLEQPKATVAHSQ